MPRKKFIMRLLVNNLLEKKVEITISLLLFLSLFNNVYSSVVAIFLVLIIFREKKQFKLTNSVILLILFFCYLIVRELFDVDKKRGFNTIIRLLPLLFFAITIGQYKFRQIQYKFISNAIIWINYLFYITSIFYGLYLYIENVRNAILLDFSYYQWVIPIKLNFHPPFWGLFINLSIVFVLFNENVSITKKNIFSLISFVFLLFLSSRTALIVFFILSLFKLFYIKSIKVKLLSIILFLFISLIVVINSSYLLKKIKNNDGVFERVKLWTATKRAIEKDYFFGNSFSQNETEIKSFYEAKYTPIANYDPHNLFMFFMSSIGIIGLILFLSTMFYCENKTLSFMLFLLVFNLSFMTESILNRQMGVIIYALFFNLFTNKHKK